MKKLDLRSREGIIIGYSGQSKRTKTLVIESETVSEFRDVTFDEYLKDTSNFFPNSTVHYRNDVVFRGGEVKEEFESNIDFGSINQEMGIEGRIHIYADSFTSSSTIRTNSEAERNRELRSDTQRTICF